MKDLDVQYSFSSSEWNKIVLRRHMGPMIASLSSLLLLGAIYFFVMVFVVDGNDNNLLITATIIFFVAVLVHIIISVILRTRNMNLMMRGRCGLYIHHLQIKDNHVLLKLTSQDMTATINHEFDIQEVKKIKGAYIIFKDRHDYFYLPDKYVEEKAE